MLNFVRWSIVEIGYDTETYLPGTPRKICNQQNITLTMDDISDLNGSLILSLERTLFSCLNNAYLIVFVGIGLMMVGSNDDRIPNAAGNKKKLYFVQKNS